MTLPGLTHIDALAVAWFLVCWFGYTRYADHGRAGRRTLMATMDGERLVWMRRMLGRENRIVDTTLIGNLMRSVTFFASTTILILGGILAVLGGADQAMALVSDLPFTVAPTRLAWEIKLLLLLLIFVYAFFKFTWSLRQFNYCSILIGAAPEPGVGGEALDADELEAYAAKTARLNTLAASHFNRGLRAYYFGLAALAWFVQPLAFIAASAWVVGVLWRREFQSRTLTALLK